MKKIFSFIIAASITSAAFAQSGQLNDWFLKDPSNDNMNGVSIERTYKELLKGKPSRTVIVAVIDSGVDYLHEDLKDVMWVNEDEIPGDGKDNDNNGYIDDINGWSFIGSKKGNVSADQLEITRIYAKMKPKFENANRDDLDKKGKQDYDFYQKIKKVVEEKLEEAKAGIAQMDMTAMMITSGLDAIEKALGGKSLTKENLDGITDNSQGVQIGKRIVTEAIGEDPSASIASIKKDLAEQIEEGKNYYRNQADFQYNPDFDGRSIVGDNYDDPYEKFYGSNDVKGPDSFHGTHVAGIIGATRNNKIGIDGIADNIRIMSVRTVPDGDERDKDVANAIRYAVDNGAEVINMSFGKGYSPNKDVVDAAIKYAEKNDVLLIHAAGNDGKDTQVEDNFPTRVYSEKGLFGKKKMAKNWMEIGALSYKKGKDLPATFSNYGKKSVDVFAPGVQIYSTTPENEYKMAQGTSMAAPMVCGVAAVLRSYFPSLSAVQIKQILEDSSTKSTEQVNLPGSKGEKQVSFGDLSKTGGYINTHEAVKKASNTKGKRKNVPSTSKAKIVQP